MRLLFHLLTASLAWPVFGGQAVAACAPAQILRDDVLVVVNDNSISSPQVGDYYCDQRGINPDNVAHLRVPVTNDVELDQFISLRDQLIKHMQENTLPPGMVSVACDTSQGYTRYYCPGSIDQLHQHSRIRYLVMTKGLPIRFRFTGSTLVGNPEASVDNYLRFWLTNYFSEDVVFRINHRAIAFSDGRGMRTIDPVIDHELIVGRIDGIDVESAKRLVDRAINVERNGIYGKLYGNKFGGEHPGKSGPEGAYWKSWLPNGSTETVYPSWHYLHGLFGELQGLADPAVRHTINPACLDYDAEGRVPKECVTAVNEGAVHDSFPLGDAPPGAPMGRLPSPDNALVHQGYFDTFSSLLEFDHLLNWRDSANCNTLCDQNDAVCKAASTDAYKEIDTRCVRVADGYMGYVFGSYPAGLMASWPTGWFQSVNAHPEKFDLTGSNHYYYWQPEVRDDEGFDDNFSLWYRNTDDSPSSDCYAAVEDYLASPDNHCTQDKKINLNQTIAIPESAINLDRPQKITLRFKYRAIGLNKDVPVQARLLLRESVYEDGVITIEPNNQVTYDSMPVKTLFAPDDPADGISWGNAIVTFTLDPALHLHPLYLYDGIKIRIETSTRFEGEFALDSFSVEKDSVDIPLVNPSFNDGHRQLSGGDSAATFLSRMNGAAFWGNITHHEGNGHSFDTHPYETLIYFMRGLPLGDAVWFAETHNGGILYGDPLYTPVAIHLHYLSGSDKRAPNDHFDTTIDSPLALTGDTLNGSGVNITTTYSVDFCSGGDFLPCDQNNSWLPVAGLQNRPGGQRNMSLGDWDISGLAEGDYVLRLAVTSANAAKGLSQTFYDYYAVTMFSPSSDTDADGLSNQKEVEIGTDPWNNDSDADGLTDDWEVNFILDPLTASTNADSDSDGFTDFVEFKRGSDPADSQSVPAVSTLEVDPTNGIDNGKSPFKTVMAAISSAQAGDTILLLPGNHIADFISFTVPVQLQGQPDRSTILKTIFSLWSSTIGTIVVSDLSVHSTNLSIAGSTWRFERNDFSANVKINSSSSVEFVNNVFANASQDAVNISSNSSVTLRNNTLTDNNVGVRADVDSSVQIINSIITGNTSADLVGVSPAAVSYSLTGNVSLAGTNGNFSVDPQFVDPLNNDYHLLPDSPAIDTGDPLSDFSREPVSVIGRVNLGLYGNTAEAAVATPKASGGGSTQQAGQSTGSGRIDGLLLLWFLLHGLWRIRSKCQSKNRFL